MKSLPAKAILRILLIYALASGLWIFFSDRWLAIFFQDPAALTTVQTYKGWLFVLASCALLYILLKREQLRENKIVESLNNSRTSSLVLFASNPIPMLVYDSETFDILAANDSALKLYGYDREEFTSLTFDTILHPRETMTDDSSHHHEAGEAKDVQHHRTRSGEILTVTTISHSLDFNGRMARLVAIQDITERTRIERAYQKSELSRIEAETSLQLDESRLEALNRLNQSSGSSLYDTANFVLEEAARLTGSEYSFIALSQGDQLQVQLSTQEDMEFSAFQVACDDLPTDGLVNQVFTTQAPATTLSSDSLFPGILPASGYSYQAAIPIMESNKLAAIAGVSGRSAPYTDADFRQLALLAGGLWRIIQQGQILQELQESRSRLISAVENLPFDFWIQDQEGRFVLQNQSSQESWGTLLGKKVDEDNLDRGVVELWKAALERAASGRVVRAEITYPDRPEKGAYYNIVAPIRDGKEIRGTLGMNISIAALKERERELDALVSVAAAMQSATNQAEMRSAVLNNVMELLQLDGAALVSQDDHSNKILVDLALGTWANRSGKFLTLTDSKALNSFQTGGTHWSSRIEADPVMHSCPLFKEVASGACISLKTQGKTVNSLWVGSRQVLTASQIHLLEAIADIAGSAINRAELNAQTERHLQRMTALRAIDLAITSSLDVRLTLNILLSQIMSQLEIDAADVLLFSPHNRQLEHAASRGFTTEVIKSVFLQLGESHAGRAALERKQVFLGDIKTEDAWFYGELRKAGENFASYLAQPLVAKGQIKGVLEVFQNSRLDPTPDWLDFLEAVAAQAAIAIDNAELFDTLQQANTDLTVAYDATIEGWSRALELRDRETQGHTQRVTGMTLRLAEMMGLKSENLVNIRRGVLLHDIGKMAIPDRILLKPGPLTTEEWETMRKHPQFAQEMLSSIPYLRSAMDIPYSHHERWDGSGYPRGLKENQIPLAARLFAAIDIWDALTTDRPYRKAWPKEKVIHYLQEQAGKRLDPEIVSFFTSHLNEF